MTIPKVVKVLQLKRHCKVTNAVLEEVKAWQDRPLDEVYPIVYLDCLRVKVQQDGKVIDKSVYLALGINMDGHKELLGYG